MTRGILISIVFATLCVFNSQAQSHEPIRTYEHAAERNPWLDALNPSAICLDSVTLATAALQAGVNGGDFRQYSDAPIDYDVKVGAAAIKHFKNNISMKGSFSFLDRYSPYASGSMFINPGAYPVDIYEFTPGAKNLQTYHMDGSIGAMIAKGLRLGGMFDFTSSNYSKRKDLRYTDYMLDMTAAISLMYSIDKWNIGLSYAFSRIYEAVKAEQIGTGADSYYAFLEKADSRGTYEIWTNAGVHLSESGVSGGFPYQDNTHRVALQASYKATVVELQALFSSGKVGEKGYDWFKHSGIEGRLLVASRFDLPLGFGYFKLDASYKHLDNNQSIIEKTTTGGVTTPTIYGWNQILKRNTAYANPYFIYDMAKYAFYLGVDWDYMTEFDCQMYPTFHSTTRMHTMGRAGFIYRTGGWEVDASIHAGGGLTQCDDLQYKESYTTSVYFHEEIFNWKNDWCNAVKAKCALKFKYTWPIGIYLGAQASYLRAFGEMIVMPACDRACAAINFGYNFKSR